MQESQFEQIVYPIHRILSNPTVFYLIEATLGGPPVEIIKTAFYGMIELDMYQNQTS